MTLPATKKIKVSIRLAQDIANEMYVQNLREGDKYYSEADALRHHKVARGTLREALRYLELQGAIRIRVGPGGGAIVRQPGWPHLASTIALIMQFAGAPFREVLEARSALEPGLAALAATHADTTELTDMARDLDVMDGCVGDYGAFSEAYHRFWERFAISTGNTVLAYLSPALRAIVDSVGFRPDESYRVEILSRMRAIHSAIADRNAESARTLMSALEDEFLERLTSRYPRQMERVVSWSDLDIPI